MTEDIKSKLKWHRLAKQVEEGNVMSKSGCPSRLILSLAVRILIGHVKSCNWLESMHDFFSLPQSCQNYEKFDMHLTNLNSPLILFETRKSSEWTYSLIVCISTCCGSNVGNFPVSFAFTLQCLVLQIRRSSSYPGLDSGKMRMLVLVLLALVPDVAVGADSKAVTTTLTTKWPSTPLLLEARYISLHHF